jgi:hypothetical protein
MIETSVVYPSVEAMLAARGVLQRADGSYAEDSYDYGVWWTDEDGGVYRLTWVGGRLRDENPPPGELYLVRLDGPTLSVFELREAAEVVSHLGYYERYGHLDEDEEQRLVDARVIVHSAGSARGGVELLCVVPPVPGGTPDENVERILDGWAEVCGSPNSRAWIYDRAWEALAAGWARDPREAVVFDVG